MIPKILHRMWLDKNITNNLVAPKKYDTFIKSFDDNNPEFKIMFWNMDLIKKLFDENPVIAKYRTTWEKMPNHIQKCDFARYLIIYLYGGIYVDLDFMCFRNLGSLLDRELLLVFEPREHSKIYQDPVDARLYNGLIGSIPKHLFWIDWVDFIIESLKQTSDVMYTTGPVNFRIFFNQSKYKNVPLVSTCDLLPIFIHNDVNYITSECIERNNGSSVIGSDDYYKTFNNYTHTKWSEGSNWGVEQLEAEYFPPERKNKKLLKYVIVLFVLVLIIMIIFSILVLLKY
jgi:mannosyltransferase OCH1-like enzyme